MKDSLPKQSEQVTINLKSSGITEEIISVEKKEEENKLCITIGK